MNPMPEPPATLISPQLSVRDGRAAVAFYRAAFGAEVDFQIGGDADNPALVAQLTVAGASFWVADESPENQNFSPETLGGGSVRMLLLVADPDSVVARALAAGATEVYPVTDGYDWRLGRIVDPYGHHWEIGRPLVPWPPAVVGSAH